MKLHVLLYGVTLALRFTAWRNENFRQRLKEHDLVVQIKGVDGTFAEGSSTATLTGYLFDGTEIVGRDDICLLPPPDSRRRGKSGRRGRSR